jgi:hypothetical protein
MMQLVQPAGGDNAGPSTPSAKRLEMRTRCQHPDDASAAASTAQYAAAWNLRQVANITIATAICSIMPTVATVDHRIAAPLTFVQPANSQ